MKRILRIISIFSVCLFLTGCATAHSNIESYKYAILLSDQERDGYLEYYDNKGNKIGKIELPYHGIDENGTSYLSGPQQYNGYSYVGAISSNKKQEKIIKVNNKDLSIDELNVGNYTNFQIINDYIYVTYTIVNEGTTLKKINLETGEIVNEKIISGIILPMIAIYNNDLILIGNKENKNFEDMEIITIDSNTLETKDKINIENMKSAYSYELLDNNLYFIPRENNKGDKIKELFVYNFENKESKKFEIPLEDVRYIKIINNKLYAFQDNMDFNKDSMFIMNLEDKKVEKTINLDYKIREIQFSEKEIVIASNNKVYTYNLDNSFNLINTFNFDINEDMMFGGLLVK